MAIVYIVGIVSSPYYGFDLFLGSKENSIFTNILQKFTHYSIKFFFFRHNLYDNR